MKNYWQILKVSIIVSIFALCVSCKTSTKIVEVPVESIKTEYINTVSYDSIYVHDSIDRYINGDTVLITKYKNIYKYIQKNDTIIKNDSIQVPVKVETIKEVNVIKKWQQGLMFMGMLFLVAVVFAIYKLVRRVLGK